MVINRASPVAAHRQLAAILLDRITSGRYKPGEPIPSEAGLMREFGVSRTAVRNAVLRLRSRDRVITVAGRGTYMAGPAAGVQAKTGGLSSTSSTITPGDAS